jgi:probable phosphoglycerate mutase
VTSIETSVEAGPGDGPAFVVPDLPEHADIWIVRHGETEWSANGRHTSVTDLPLTEAGRRQAAAVRDVLGDIAPALVLSSPRRRALETAEHAGLAVDDTTEDLAEWFYGAYEGKTTSEIRAEQPGWTIWRDGPRDGETAAAVQQRADRVLTRAIEALQTATEGDGPVVLIGHGHFSRVLGARWIGLPPAAGGNLLLGTAAPSLLGVQYGLPVIDRWNLPNPAAEETNRS